MSEYFFKSLSAQSWQYHDRSQPNVGTMPSSYRMPWRILYSVQYHRQHCKHQALQLLWELYMHNLDDKHPRRPGFALIPFRATTGSNQPSGPAGSICRPIAVHYNKKVMVVQLLQTWGDVSRRDIGGTSKWSVLAINKKERISTRMWEQAAREIALPLSILSTPPS